MIFIRFFPFTRMDKEQFRVMGLFFNRFKMLTLGPDIHLDPQFSSAVKTGAIDPVFIGDAPLAALETKLRSFREWAAVHKGNEKNLKTLIRENAYFQDETDVTAIQTGIRQGVSPLSGNKTEAQGVTDPFLFLRFAEILDRENEEIRNELYALEQNSRSLFAELKGEIDPSESIEEPGERHTGGDKIGARISAWCTAAQASGFFDPEEKCPVLATTNPAVLDYLMADTNLDINGLDIDSIKVHEHECDRREPWQQKFYQTIDKFISGSASCSDRPDESDCSCRTGGVRLIRFPGGVLNDKFNIPGTQVVVCLVKLNS